MAEIQPFHGYRYDPAVAGDPGRLIAPPYDVIDDAVRSGLYRLSEYNIARITRAERLPSPPARTPYDNAAAVLADWRNRNVIKRDDTPGIYVYEQFFEVHGKTLSRTGMIAIVRLEKLGHGILPHENTVTAPRVDRLDLMHATGFQFGQVLGLYSSDNDELERVLEEAKSERPIVQAVDYAESLHRLWAVVDAETIAAIQEKMRNKRILIADGHHRYETSLAYHAEHPDCEAAAYRMMTLVNMSNVGLVVLPIHRLVKGIENFDAQNFIASLRRTFTVKAYPGESAPVRAAVLDAVRIRQAEGRHAFGLYVGDGCYYTLTLQHEGAMEEANGHSKTWRRLDVNIAQRLILEERLGITRAHLEEGAHIEYVQDLPYALQGAAGRVQSGGAQALLLLNPTRVEEVEAVAHAGERMPQKSTFFYPKAYTGMVFYGMHD